MDHTDHITVDELLARHTVNPSRLEPASSEASGRDVRARLREPVVRPCTVCGEDYRTSTVVTFHGGGPRWVDLWREHTLATMGPWRGPATVQGVLADLREVAAELAAESGRPTRVRTWTDEEGWRDERHA
ncbi:hypothetical protein A6P39_045205 (plasmid) [Streptomyces sp. FXJ1.172]|uniref:hypothetical protein n=1 Tax=Streptomyces sp. FXJ1.172 TaxID=710705 RepID=UPI0023DD4271|nr:hypothetical protein [Streptomyces sp. FXJ1.172]WEP01048.1 hypothetical protein A6P39_045205 [Streptomyces sp. FXJ1.172]